jgi:hypothetical protein
MNFNVMHFTVVLQDVGHLTEKSELSEKLAKAN